MPNPIRRLLRKRRYGEEIVIVSGLPRSGTSMMMKMLEAGGLKVMTDAIRAADEDNPRGYFEDERVKDLEKAEDKAWLQDARGKVLKVISYLLKDLPPDNFYRVILMRRDIDEVLASQAKMLVRRNEADETDNETMRNLYLGDLARVRVLAKRAPNIEMVEVKYREALEQPAAVARAVNAFLDHRLDEQAMASVIDPELYRNRKEKLAGAGGAGKAQG